MNRNDLRMDQNWRNSVNLNVWKEKNNTRTTELFARVMDNKIKRLETIDKKKFKERRTFEIKECNSKIIDSRNLLYTRKNNRASDYLGQTKRTGGLGGSSMPLGRNEVKWMDGQRKRDGRGGRGRRTIEPEEPKYSNFRGNSMKEA